MAITYLNNMLSRKLKDSILSNKVVNRYWSDYKTQELHRSYIARRESYQTKCEELNWHYSETLSVLDVRERLALRGYRPTKKKPGDVHTFVFIPLRSGHANLVHDIEELGKVTVFNYEEHGYSINKLRQASSESFSQKRELNNKFLEKFREAYAADKIDWLFVYATGHEIARDAIKAIQEEFGTPVVSLCMDDKQSWTGPFMGDHRAGQIDLAAVFDLSITTALETTAWYKAEGGIPVYMPEGFSSRSYHRLSVDKTYPVCFVGSSYGPRKRIVDNLVKFRIPVRSFGKGWNTGWAENDNLIFNSSLVNLGIGGIGYSEELTNVKGRDFDIPGSGGGVYITTYNCNLARHFEIGKEILCYKNDIELVELIRYYIVHRDEAEAIAEAGYKRALADHRWLNRYRSALEIIGVF